MKKFLAIGITTLGSFGLLGMAATSASATTVTARSQVCTSATNQLASLTVPLATATATANVDGTAADNATSAVGTAETAYINAAFVVVNDVDTSASAGQQAVDVGLFNTSVTNFVNAVVASSRANVTFFGAQAAVTQLNLQSKVLNDMINESC
jgi:hypothetical protein